ncbi:MAG: hypothetical protein PHO15_03560 [Eubacteriales bacterium]|nr:hypothetical protein [Eubacteriales bacterium]
MADIVKFTYGDKTLIFSRDAMPMIQLDANEPRKIIIHDEPGGRAHFYEYPTEADRDAALKTITG